MDRNVNIGIEERIRMAMDDLDDLSLQALKEKKTDLLYDINNAYSDLRSAYLKAKASQSRKE